uniref:Uncharacterized protein n=1 Tax=Magallana gigas TaxID=29159 RepID=K1QAL2_MAGGI
MSTSVITGITGGCDSLVTANNPEDEQFETDPQILGSILERTTSAKGRSCSSLRPSAGTRGSANETEMKN